MGIFIQPPFWAEPYSADVAPHATWRRQTANATDPIDLATAKLYARLNVSDTSLDAILPGIITTLRRKAEVDTGIITLTETYDVFFDRLPGDRTPIDLPWRPVTAISSVSSIDSAGVTQVLDAANYTFDGGGEAPRPARLALTTSGVWPSDLRPFQPITVRLVAGYATAAAVPKQLVHAVGLLVDAYVNRLSLDMYEDTIAPYRLVTVA